MIIKFIKDLFSKEIEIESILDTKKGIVACELAAEMFLHASETNDKDMLIELRNIYSLDDFQFVDAVHSFYKTQFKK